MPAQLRELHAGRRAPFPSRFVWLPLKRCSWAFGAYEIGWPAAQRVAKHRNSVQQRRWRSEMSEKPAYSYHIYIGAPVGKVGTGSSMAK